MKMTDEQVDKIAWAIEHISQGPAFGPSQPRGLEAVTMALGGKGMPGDASVSGGLYAIATAIDGLAEAITNKRMQEIQSELLDDGK